MEEMTKEKIQEAVDWIIKNIDRHGTVHMKPSFITRKLLADGVFIKCKAGFGRNEFFTIDPNAQIALQKMSLEDYLESSKQPVSISVHNPKIISIGDNSGNGSTFVQSEDLLKSKIKNSAKSQPISEPNNINPIAKTVFKLIFAIATGLTIAYITYKAGWI